VKIETEIEIIYLSQGTPRIAGNHLKLKGGKEEFFPVVFRGSWPY
jgi:hypothetical protein